MGLRNAVGSAAGRVLGRFGYDLVRRGLPSDFDAEAQEIIRAVTPFTMTTAENVFSLCEATRYVERNKIPGAIVECGVWRGGSMMAAAISLAQLGAVDRDLYLFDTFEGMTQPTAADARFDGVSAASILKAKPRDDWYWAVASLEEVRENVLGTGYPPERIHFVVGRVEDTIPDRAPDTIALLRLDTDWYESTKHELVHLFPRMAPGGVIVFDDYGWWQGHRTAVDEYLREVGLHPLLMRIDRSARMAIVPYLGHD